MQQNTRIVIFTAIFSAAAVLLGCQSIQTNQIKTGKSNAADSSVASTSSENKENREENSEDNSNDHANRESANNESSKEKAPTYKLPPEIIDAEMKTLNGKNVKFSDFKGKVVLINMWATWCPPCRDEIPQLVQLSDEMKDKDFAIVGLTLEEKYRNNTPATVNAFVKEQKIPYDIVWASEDVWEQLITLTPRPSIPQSFVVNRNGEITAIFVGYNSAKTPLSVRTAVETALKSES